MAEEKIRWYRSPIPKDRLRELTQRSDFIPTIHIVSQIGLSVATGVLAYLSFYYAHWSVFIAVLFVHGSLYGFLYSPVHEMLHQTPFKTRQLNEFFLKLCCFLIWANPISMRIGHMNHHHVTVHNGLDYENPSPRVYQSWHWIFFWTFLPFDLCLVPGLFSSLKRTIRIALGSIPEYLETTFATPDPQKQKAFVNWARFLLAGHIILIAIFLYYGLWPLILLVNFPIFFAAGFGQLLGMTQHTGLVYNVPDFRLCSRTMYINPFLRYLYWNMNYHIEHHMYAAVPYLNLAALRKEIQNDLPEAKPSLWSAWKEIMPAVKRQRTDPSYCLIPVVANPKME